MPFSVQKDAESLRAVHYEDVFKRTFLICHFSVCLSEEVMSTDQSVLKYILENHILKLKVTLSELYNGQLLETLAGKLLRVFIYRTVRAMYVCVFVSVFASENQTTSEKSGGEA